MERIKRVINCAIMDTVCNFRCHYCYIGQREEYVLQSTENPHSVEEIRRALSYQRLGGCCHLSVCAGGETLLAQNVIELITNLLAEGHVVSVVTNGTITNKMQELCELPKNLRERLFVKISYHYLQLLERGMLERFWSNVNRIRQAGIAYTIELTANDETVPYVDEVIDSCRQHGHAKCHITESRKQDGKDWPRLTTLPLEEHQAAWERFESPLFHYQQTIWGKKRNEFCYAGDWIASVDLKSGDLCTCFGGGLILDNIYAHIDKPIRFQAVGNKCRWGHCYAAYVLLAHGAIPNFEAPYYAQERNRINEDGSEWLTPAIKEKFSHRLNECNEEYSEKRKALTNFAMGVMFGGLNCDDEKAVAEVLKEYLAQKHYHRVAIYGAGKLGVALYEVLKRLQVSVQCFMDRDWKKKKTEIVCYPNDAQIDNIDVIIVTAYRYFWDIEEQLSQRNKADIVSVLDMYLEGENGRAF